MILDRRGTYGFEINQNGNIVDNSQNVELLRKLWLDLEIIPEGPGVGDAGDFDNGAWHVACHLVAAGTARKTSDDRFMWLEISYSQNDKIYFPTLSIREKGEIKSIRLISKEAQNLVTDSTLLGFVEGTSEGRISASGVKDSLYMFNGSLRQEYDQIPGTINEGGRVWEHWCTTRDIRISSSIGSSILKAFISLTAASGDKFIPTIARGRLDYQHPAHLNAMVKAGLTSFDSSHWNVKPSKIPYEEDLLFQKGDTKSNFLAAEKLNWSNPMKYFMFARRIERWNSNILR